MTEIARRRLIEGGDRMVEDITIRDAKGTVETRREQRLYSAAALGNVASTAGLIVEGVFADFSKASVTNESSRLILLARSNAPTNS